MNYSRPIFVALIATCNRPHFLAKRALPSIAAQTHRPDLLIVVDDSESRYRSRNEKAVKEFSDNSGIRAIYLVNQRNKGACGAWNTGALAALAEYQDAKNMYLAILDDDDEWLSGHLFQAKSMANVDLLVTAFERREDNRSYVINPPSQLNGRDFLVGNPGVVGSTLIIRLSAFFLAGMFDEALSACTDRDLCFRLSLLPRIAYKPLSCVSVIHYADDKRIRISNPYSEVKNAGLSYFADKYRGWMDDVEYDAYCRRAKKLFGWKKKSNIDSPAPKSIVSALSKKQSGEKISLVIGMIVSPNEKNNPLFSDILELSKDKRLSSVDVVVIPSSGMHVRTLQDEMTKCRSAGLRMHCISDIKTPWYDFFGIVNSRKNRPISVNRTIVQHAVSRFAVLYKNPVCWILDGDNRLHGLGIKKGKLSNFDPDYVGEMIRLRDSGCDIAIGKVNGAAPLPRAFTVRTQMVDLLHEIGRLQQGKDKHRPTESIANITSGATMQNYHHDCLPHRHLEQPIGLPLLSKNSSLEEMIEQLPNVLKRILAGDAVTRPLVEFGDKSPSCAVHRGGNTLVFNSAVFCECPNGLIGNNYAKLRRSDEVWSIFSEAAFGRTVVGGNFPVTQCRKNEPPQSPDIERMAEDIVGHAIIMGLKNIIGKKNFNDVQEIVNVLSHEQHDFKGKVRRVAEDRLTMTRASFFRVCGVAESMRGIIEQTGNKRIYKNAVASLQNVMERFSDVKIQLLRKMVTSKLGDVMQGKVFCDFPKACEDYAKITKVWTAWIRQERKKNARISLGPSRPLRFLGQGAEGTVFTDNKQVFKVLHRWYSRADIIDSDFLPLLAKSWKTDKGLYPLVDSQSDGGDLILTMPFEKNTAYKGGCGIGMVALLADMQCRGMVLWDISPENLRQKGNTIRLIDYGKDINPFTDKNFDLAVRKAWLCWRWAFRSDLRCLLTSSLNNSNMPELAGYEMMKKAVEKYSMQTRVSDFAMKNVSRDKSLNILDYGCGKGKDAKIIAKKGFCVSAFDPMLTQETEHRLKSSGVHVIKDISRASGEYDIIFLRHVVCEINRHSELKECLKEIRRLVAKNGKVVITACDPNGLVKDNTCANNIIPHTADKTKKFSYRKRIRSTGNIHSHAHRPENMLLREFSRAGFRMESKTSFPDIDLNSFESCGGSSKWLLRPISPCSSASLIIRVCAMDAKYFESQVRHLVEQLNYPRGFSEIIVAIDSKKEKFLREHTQGDLSALMFSARQLQQQGWIDRIVVAPTDESSLRLINKKWLGIDGDFSHAKNGAPLSVVFAAFDACRTRYALHIDIDVIVGRKDKNYDYLGKILKTMGKRDAFTMSLDVPGADDALHKSNRAPFRLEVAAGVTDISKLKKLRPLQADLEANIPTVGWHCMADVMICRNKLLSLRGGGQWPFVVYPPNKFKHRHDELDIITNSLSCGFFSAQQNKKNIWNGESNGWLPETRREKFIFIICGRNVSVGKIDRCLNSVIQQKNHNWGAVLMDDFSHESCAKHLLRWKNDYPSQITYFSRRIRAGGLANLAFAVRRLCSDPESIIITLDMDDALIGEGVLERLSVAYNQGADMTSGSMLRTDKQAEYAVCFDNPRAHRGGNVWQHLRSFKKRLFEEIPDSALRDDNREYFELAQDWAYMLPIVEMAKHPVWIKDALYLYEPDAQQKQQQKLDSENTVGRIVSRPVVLPPDQADFYKPLQRKAKA